MPADHGRWLDDREHVSPARPCLREHGALITTPGRPSNATSTGRRRSSGPAGARPETAAAASCARAGSRSASSSETDSTSASGSTVMTRQQSPLQDGREFLEQGITVAKQSYHRPRNLKG